MQHAETRCQQLNYFDCDYYSNLVFIDVQYYIRYIEKSFFSVFS